MEAKGPTVQWGMWHVMGEQYVLLGCLRWVVNVPCNMPYMYCVLRVVRMQN